MNFLSKAKRFVIAKIISNFCEKLHNILWTSASAKIPSSIKLNDIMNFFRSSGIKKGDTVMIHSAWEPLNSGNFNVGELIRSLIEYLGPEGTLLMPAFPHDEMQQTGIHFDIKRTPSAAGLLSEAFRRYPGVKRSINLNHSVCGLGLNAEFLLNEHHLSETSFDTFSPYFKIRDIENSWIVGLGVGHRLKVATSLHCVESILQAENNYFKKLFGELICYTFQNQKGVRGEHCFRKRIGQIYTPKLAKYFSKDELKEECTEGLELYSIRAKTLIDKSIALGRKGKTMYVYPVPWFWYFS